MLIPPRAERGGVRLVSAVRFSRKVFQVRRISLALSLLLVWGTCLLRSQSMFQIPLVIRNGPYVKVHRLGVDPHNTIGLDRDTLLGVFLESPAPPLPPSPFPMDSRFLTVPGRTQLYPAGLAGGVYSDFRDFRDTAQVDSFLVRVQGTNLLNSSTVISWPADLGRYASSWSIRTIGSADLPPADMLQGTSATVLPDPLAGLHNILIIKGGARPSVFPAGTVDQVVEGPGSYRFDQGSNPFDAESNQTAVVIDFSLAAGPGAVTVERYAGSAANLQFSSARPPRLGRYRWVIAQTGLAPFSARISFEHAAFNSGVKDQNSIIVYWRPEEGKGVFAPLPQASPSDPLLVRVNVTEFGEFIFGANDDQLEGIARTGNSPLGFELEQNYPNPFNPETTIRYSLPVADQVSLKVVDILGRDVANLVDGYQPAGAHSVTFNAANQASGVYFYRLQSRTRTITKKMLHLK